MILRPVPITRPLPHIDAPQTDELVLAPLARIIVKLGAILPRGGSLLLLEQLSRDLGIDHLWGQVAQLLLRLPDQLRHRLKR